MYIWKHLFDYTRDQRASTFPVDLFLDPKDIFCIIHIYILQKNQYLIGKILNIYVRPFFGKTH